MTNIFIGVLSGTSMDAIDVGAFSFDNNTPKYLASCTTNLPSEYKIKYQSIIDAGCCDLVTLGELDRWTGELFAAAVLNFLQQEKMAANDICAIGSHGQTLWHAPFGAKPFTMQIGDPNIIAMQTGITTVADFRRADVAAGGQGAPLAPAFHQAVFASPNESRCVVNIGGINNISILQDGTVFGFDTGPGNCILDLWTQQHFNMPYDRDGALARTGKVLTKLLETCLNDPYFSKAPPKSSGKEYFNAAWLERQLLQSNAVNSAAIDILTTLTHLTATCIATAVQKYASNSSVFLCGGGAYNTLLCEILSNLLGYQVQTTTSLGINPQFVEAALFAWLAQQNLLGNKLDLHNITGSKVPVILGAIYSQSHLDLGETSNA